MFSLIRNIPRANKHALAGKWERNKFPGHQLSDMTVGIVGYGRVNKYLKYFHQLQKKSHSMTFKKILGSHHLLIF